MDAYIFKYFKKKHVIYEIYMKMHTYKIIF